MIEGEAKLPLGSSDIIEIFSEIFESAQMEEKSDDKCVSLLKRKTQG